MNPSLAPRDARCWFCKNVAMIEDVTLRLFDEEGAIDSRVANPAVRDYMTSIGHQATTTSWKKRIDVHRRHVEDYLWAKVDEVAPIRMDPNVTVVRGPSSFVDVNQTGMDVGLEALRMVSERLERGYEMRMTKDGQVVEVEVDTKDLVSIAKLGQTAASKRGDWTAKGRLRQEGEALSRLASGLAE